MVTVAGWVFSVLVHCMAPCMKFRSESSWVLVGWEKQREVVVPPEARRGGREMLDAVSRGCIMRRRKDSTDSRAPRSPSAGPGVPGWSLVTRFTRQRTSLIVFKQEEV